MKMKTMTLISLCCLVLSCSKSGSTPPPVVPPAPSTFNFSVLKVDGVVNPSYKFFDVGLKPSVSLTFSEAIDHASANASIRLTRSDGGPVEVNYTYRNNDSTVVLLPISELNHLTRYTLAVTTSLRSVKGNTLLSPIGATLTTLIDSSDKFPVVSDDDLLTLIQKQTFKYFWDFGHPVSGLARERDNGNDETVTTGGSGFGIMAMVAAVHRGFVSRKDAVTRLLTITEFLIDKCETWHGAFSHWINGTTGATIPFGKNNGADIVETSFLIEGLLTARQYFDSNTDADEATLRNNINQIYKNVDWQWFTQNGIQNGLYWQYNPDYTSTNDIWSIPVTGWNEALVTYILAASNPDYTISKTVYDQGWARSGAMKNGNTYYGTQLPLGPNLGGPLFFSHYSFLGLDPAKISDQYADYLVQNTAHSKINYQYCAANPGQYYGYSDLCWGLTASDDPGGYSAHSPTNDNGTISPTAAISSLPYTPEQSMAALKFFYYQLGDKLWGQYGFIGGFNLGKLWFSNSYLAIDQGPQIVMIENYRSGLLWNLFMSCPEVQHGLSNLGFTIQ